MDWDDLLYWQPWEDYLFKHKSTGWRHLHHSLYLNLCYYTHLPELCWYLLLQLRFPQKSQTILLWKMLHQVSSQGAVFFKTRHWYVSSSQIMSSRFFSEGFDSKRTASLESCVADYYFHSLAATAVFADTTANKCWFGVSSTTTGNIVVSASSWTVFVKIGKPKIS